MKKYLLCMALVLSAILAGCGGGQKPAETQQQTETQKQAADMSMESIMADLKKNVESMNEYLVYDENTDTNKLLGRPGQYIGKAVFSDTRIGGDLSQNNDSGTIEVFEKPEDCTSRCDYLKQFLDNDVAFLRLNQYIYKYEYAVLRVSFDLTPSQAEEYKKALDAYLGEEGVLTDK